MLVDILKAMSEIHRLYILASCSQQEVYTCQIVNALGISQSTVSNHIKVLKTAGLLELSKQKTWNAYYLPPSLDSCMKAIVSPVLARVYQDPGWQSFHEKLLDSELNGPCE